MIFSTTQRYLLYSFIVPFILASFFFSTFLLAIETFKLVGTIVGKGVSLSDIVTIFFYTALGLLPVGLPLASFFATYYAFNRLGQDSEIIAMRSIGMGRKKIFTPFAVLALLLLLASLSLTSTLVPYAKQRSMETVRRLDFETVFASMRSEEFFTEIPGLLFFAEKIHADTREMSNVFVRMKRGLSGPEQIISAKFGQFDKRVDEQGSIDIVLSFEDGSITKFDSAKDKLEKVFFATYEYPLFGRHIDSFQSDRISLLSSSKLKERMKVEKNEQRKLDMKVEYVTRINNALQIFNFMWLGLCFGLRTSSRRNSNKEAVWGFMTLIFYYVVFFLCVSFADRGIVIPELAIYTPSLLLFSFALFLFRKLDWNS